MNMHAITIDTSRSIGAMAHPERLWNTSMRVAPSKDIIGKAVSLYGKPRIVRAWVVLNEYWDYRDDSYHPDHIIGADRHTDDAAMFRYDRTVTRPSSVSFREYFDAVSSNAEEVLLCIRRYEREVMRGIISEEKYEAVLTKVLLELKERYSNIRWLEVLNESESSIFGGLDADTYYRFYRMYYRAVAAVNARKLPGPELGIGGPISATDYLERVYSFLKRYAADTDTSKRLDFICHHDYTSSHRPVRIGELRECIDGWLAEFGLPQTLPVFISEIGIHEALGKDNLRYAAGVMTVLQEAYRHRFIPMPWCLHHDIKLQLGATMLLADGRPTPYGNAMAMCALHGDEELAVAITGNTDPCGLGVRAWASRSKDGGIALTVWHYGGIWHEIPAVAVRIAVPGNFHMRHYRIDADAGNCLTHPEKNGLACIDERTVTANSYLELPFPRDALSSFVFRNV
ncbi:MAG: hypothetical protein AABZ39_16555 [Spirochaetota bacterium]